VNRKHLERQVSKHLHQLGKLGPGLHHLLAGPQGQEHAALILGALIVLLIIASYFGRRTSGN
jgi:hypothetical protein